MDNESTKEAMGMSSMMLSNLCDPITSAILEDDLAELMGGQILYSKFGFSSLHDLLAAWFECSWIGGEVIIVPVLTQRLKEVVSQTYI